MQKTKKTLAIITAILITISTFAILGDSSIVQAHDPPWELPTHAYISVSPNPIGVGQEALVIFWLDRTIQGTAITNNIRYRDYQLTITAPDGTVQTQTWDIVMGYNNITILPIDPNANRNIYTKLHLPRSSL
jgi:hypothetical protein